MTKRYLLTGSGLIIFLVVLVMSVRLVRGTASSVPYENTKMKGSANAPVHLIVYSDFQCPACKNAVAPIHELMTQFPDNLKVEFRHFPLERPHKWALVAATFAQCVAEQGKFWEFHDLLFNNQTTWSSSPDPLVIFAGMIQELSLNTEQFELCVKNPNTLALIRKEHSLGSKQSVQSTPTIFINGQALVGALQLKEKGPGIIAEEIKKNQKTTL